jgi:5-formyltetrahydrofolate cyclo-ligase
VNGAEHLFIYVNFRSEVKTMNLIIQLIAAGKTISVPLTLLEKGRIEAIRLTDPDSQLIPGCYGILEPSPALRTAAVIDPATLDTVLVPGSVFDPQGGRLGYGGGFYDRFLTESAPQAYRMGLAFNQQMVNGVPMEPHDQYMDSVLTEQQHYDCRRNRNAQDSSIQG